VVDQEGVGEAGEPTAVEIEGVVSADERKVEKADDGDESDLSGLTFDQVASFWCCGHSG